jgi:FkbM family methyltransferase
VLRKVFMSFTSSIKNVIQERLRLLGWEIRSYELPEMAQLTKYLRIHEVTCVLDVGANAGQFGSELRATGYSGKIISFEPQSKAYARLTAMAATDPLWTIAPRCAVGAASGEIEMNISDNSVSSSALPILEAHTGSAPASRYVSKETAPVIRLDDCDLIPRGARLFLKIDTQGFEQHVIDGAPELIKLARGIQMEMSLAPLYEGQADFMGLMDQMQKAGFDLWALNPGFADRGTGRLLQADSTFFRS